VNDKRQLAYSLLAGAAISGLVFWLAFWHGRVLVGTFAGFTIVLLYWLRYNGTKQWKDVHRHGSRRAIRRYENKIVILILLVVSLCVFLVTRMEHI